jgi:hypothetical protein
MGTGILLGIFMLLFLKMLPAYTEYFGLKSVLQSLVKEQAGAPAAQIREAYVKKADIENIHSITPDDLDISVDGTGTTIAVNYAKKIPLVANVNLLIEFSTSVSKANPTQ